jgi:hypothetical protein
MNMKPITIEFNINTADGPIREEAVSLQSPEELFRYVAPGGGCEAMPDDTGEIQMVFMPPAHPNTQNPIADTKVTLQLGMVFLTGPLSEIVQTAEMIIDKSGRGELSNAFLTVIGTSK